MRRLARQGLRLVGVPPTVTWPAQPAHVKWPAVVGMRGFDPLLTSAALFTGIRTRQDAVLDSATNGSAGAPVWGQPLPILTAPAVASGQRLRSPIRTLRVSLPPLGCQSFTVGIGVLAQLLGESLMVPGFACSPSLRVRTAPCGCARRALHITLAGARTTLDDVVHSRAAALRARRSFRRRTLVLHRLSPSGGVLRPDIASNNVGLSCVNYTPSLRAGAA